MIKKLINSQGFTFIELAIYIGILSILLLVLTGFFTSALNAKIETQSSSGIQQDSRFILSRLYFDISNAESVVSPSSNGSSGTSLTIVKSGINYTYTKSGDNLTLTDNTGTEVLNSPLTKITSINFKRIGYSLGLPTIKVTFTASSSAKKNSGYDSLNFQTTVGLRGT